MDNQYRCSNPNKKRKRLNGRRLSLSKAARKRRKMIKELSSCRSNVDSAESRDNPVRTDSELSTEMNNSPYRNGERMTNVRERPCNLNMDMKTEVEPPCQNTEKSYPVLVRGSFHQADDRFPEPTRGKQCTANAAAALAMCTIADPNLWTTETVDAILISGDKLYTDSMAARGNIHPAEKNSEYLTVMELNKEFDIGSEKCGISIKDSMFGHLDNDHSNYGFPNLLNRLRAFLTDTKYGILTSNSISVAVFRVGNTMRLFDSHSRGPAGEVVPDGRACLLDFADIESMCNLLRKNIPSGSSARASADSYELTEIDIQRQFRDKQLSISTNRVPHSNENNVFEEDCFEEECLKGDCLDECNLQTDGLQEKLCLLSDETSAEQPDIRGNIANIAAEEQATEEHELKVSQATIDEGLQDISTLERGIYSFNHMWMALHEAFDEHEKGVECYFRNIRLVGYRRIGLKTLFRFKCSMCSYQTSIMSEPEHESILDINKSAVLGSISAGIGHSQLEQILGAMDVKCMAASTFRRHYNAVYDLLSETAVAEIKSIGDEERKLAVQRNPNTIIQKIGSLHRGFKNVEGIFQAQKAVAEQKQGRIAKVDAKKKRSK